MTRVNFALGLLFCTFFTTGIAFGGTVFDNIPATLSVNSTVFYGT